MGAKTFTIGRLAAQADVNVETVRYYQRRGLIPEPERAPGQARRYSSAQLDRLRWIRRAQALGFSLREVEGLLHLSAGAVCASARAVVAQRLELIDHRMQELALHRDELRAWIASCDANVRKDCCPSLSRL